MIALKDIKKDMVFYESGYGITIECVALEDAYFNVTYNGWAFKARNTETNEVICYFGNKDHEQYHPKLFLEPEYVAFPIPKD